MPDAKEVTGGAQVEEVEVALNAPPQDDGNTLDIITTAPGTFGVMGIVPVGTREFINPAAFSAAWMKPATKKAEAVLDRYRETL